MVDAAPPRLAMVAGEASGDVLAAHLLSALRARRPGLMAAGIGGPQMQAQGFEVWWPSQRLAVHGYAEALRHYRELSAIRRELGTRLLAQPPELFIGIDAPDFNLGLEARLRAAGVRTVHFVCPTIWAWRGGRAGRLAASADHVLCLFPFEPELLARHGVAATYVGHPLADLIPPEPPRGAARAALGLADDDPVVALLPGSRNGEIAHLAPVFIAAARLLLRERPRLRFVLPAAAGQRARLAALLAGEPLPIMLLDGRAHEALAACDVTLIASGTATLEAALFKRPMVVAYRMNELSWQIMRRMNYQPWVALPNILCRDFVVPELLQRAATPQALARELGRWLDEPARVLALQSRFAELHTTLRRDTARAASDAIAPLLAC